VLGKPKAIVVVPIVGIVVVAIPDLKPFIIVIVPGTAAQTTALSHFSDRGSYTATG
jgi:hypothetical protein